MIPNNDRRIQLATAALQTYHLVPDETHVCDLLTDLMHWCDHNDIDFNVALNMAHYHYIEECHELEPTDP